MQRITKYHSLKARAKDVSEFIGLIGKQSVSATAKHRGSISSISVDVTVYYQPYDGATNYHKNVYFNEVLADVIRANFDELSKKAMQVIKARETNAATDAMAELDQLREEFKAITKNSAEPAP